MKSKLPICQVCLNNMSKIFDQVLLNKYNVTYYYCDSCEVIQTEEPYWIDEAYKNPIAKKDTGILSRNIRLSKKVYRVIMNLFDKNANYLDFGGGYGIFTRLMRDMGINFFCIDPYVKNLFAEEFEYENIYKIKGVTALEVFEHIHNPHIMLEQVFNEYNAEFLLFSTLLYGKEIPDPKKWWYYSFEAGQHISIYNSNTLRFLAEKYGFWFYTNNKNLHLFSKEKVNRFKFRFFLSKYSDFLFLNNIY